MDANTKMNQILELSDKDLKAAFTKITDSLETYEK